MSNSLLGVSLMFLLDLLSGYVCMFRYMYVYIHVCIYIHTQFTLYLFSQNSVISIGF